MQTVKIVTENNDFNISQSQETWTLRDTADRKTITKLHVISCPLKLSALCLLYCSTKNSMCVRRYGKLSMAGPAVTKIHTPQGNFTVAGTGSERPGPGRPETSAVADDPSRGKRPTDRGVVQRPWSSAPSLGYDKIELGATGTAIGELVASLRLS